MRIIYISFLFVCFLSKATANENADSLYFKHAKSFIKEVYGEKLKLPRIVLVDQPKLGRNLNTIDLKFFTAEEVLAVKEQIKSPKIESWNKFLKP